MLAIVIIATIIMITIVVFVKGLQRDSYQAPYLSDWKANNIITYPKYCIFL